MSRHGYVMGTLAEMLGGSAPAPHSLFLDLVVIFETVGVVLMGKGAH